MSKVRVRGYLIKQAYTRLTLIHLTIECSLALSFLISNRCIHSHNEYLTSKPKFVSYGIQSFIELT